MNGKYLWLILPIIVGLLAIVPVIKAENVQVTAEVPPFASVVFNYNTVNFGGVTPGSTDVPAPNQDSGIYNVSVTANVPLTVSAYRTSWSPGDVLTLKFGVGATVPAQPQIELITTSQTIAIIGSGQYTHYHGYWLTVPPYASPGTYSTTVTITYFP